MSLNQDGASCEVLPFKHGNQIRVQDKATGIVVDGVSDVVALTAVQIRPPPEMRSAIQSGSIAGLATIGDHMLIPANIDTLLADEFGPAKTLAAQGLETRKRRHVQESCHQI